MVIKPGPCEWGWGERPGPRAPSGQVGMWEGQRLRWILHVGLLLLAKLREVRRGKLEAVGAPGGLLVFGVESKMSLCRGFECKPGGVQCGL